MKSNKVEKVVVFFLELHFKANVSLKMLIEQKYYQCVTKQSTYIAQIYGINYEKCQMKLIYKNCLEPTHGIFELANIENINTDLMSAPIFHKLYVAFFIVLIRGKSAFYEFDQKMCTLSVTST